MLGVARCLVAAVAAIAGPEVRVDPADEVTADLSLLEESTPDPGHLLLRGCVDCELGARNRPFVEPDHEPGDHRIIQFGVGQSQHLDPQIRRIEDDLLAAARCLDVDADRVRLTRIAVAVCGGEE